MNEEEIDDPADPEMRYGLMGMFDEAAYDDDLEKYPEYFDENGWPLFGEYDPHALKHPITGLSWHLDPRVPSENESDPDYDKWFWLATEFETARADLFNQLKGRPRVPKEDPDTDNAIYFTASKKATEGNLAYLRRHVLPELEQFFLKREHSLEFTRLWGEFCQLAESLGVSVRSSKLRNEQRKAGRHENRDDQRRWFSHYFLQEYDKHKDRLKSEEVVEALINKIINGDVPISEGFELDWFRDFLAFDGEGSDSISYGQLKTTYQDRKLPMKQMREFVKDPTENLPPLDL